MKRSIVSQQRTSRQWAALWTAVGCGLFAWCGCSPQDAPPAAIRPEQVDPAAAGDTANEATASVAAQAEPVPPPDASALDRPELSGPELFAHHCAGCHGEKGDGKSPLAAHLFPKPRDIRSGRFRLASTVNGVPSADDLDAVLRRGMSGSSMPPWPSLTAGERAALVAHVQRLHRDGMRELYVARLREEFGEDNPEVDEQELAAFVESKTTPGALAVTPDIAEATGEAIERGRRMYLKQSCHSCHGVEGKGDGRQEMVDVEGFPTRARDLTRGIYKGGHDPASVYRRIAFGMPGTPMPSSLNLTSNQIVDLVHFIRSLSDEETRRATVLRRERILARRIDAIPTDGDDAIWRSASAVTLRTMPLWWRDGGDRDLTVAAMHDGGSVAIRLSWPDATRDLHGRQPGQIEDLAAVQLYSGAVEPFLGVGGAENALDVWQWRAGAGDFRNVGSKLDGEATSRSPAANGPVGLAFIPPPSPLVAASAYWRQGRWTVTMARPLAVPPDAGMALAAGKRYSVAFVLWDGGAADRAGQQAITIWQDLRLE